MVKSADAIVQDTGTGLRTIDRIVAERPNFDGVYGPLYRLFEITDDKFNIAVELTAGNRCVRFMPIGIPMLNAR